MPFQNLEHPYITRTLLTGYPDTQHEEYEPDEEQFDEDRAYEEKREREMGWMAYENTGSL